MTALPLNLPPEATDQRTLAEREWSAPTRAKRDQRPCDHGLFSDDAKQADLPL